MGVPAFYGWLVKKYPMIVAEAVEELSDAISGVKISVDNRNPITNTLKYYDNLYLDMNGIIHPCFHPEETDDSPTTFDEVFQRIFDVVDRVFRMVRPQKLLFLAIDGVAPRAKMNQQRSRRFRAAKDTAEAAAEEERLREEFERKGKHLPPIVKTEVNDSNLITPGTKFMSDLSVALEYYIQLRLNYDPAWKNIKVILSDANVPGEGEHKIMSYIRLQRNLPGHDPNTRHCLYGLDADLIMLALATHEIHFSILREGEQKADANGVAKKSYKFLHVWILREYLRHEITIPDAPDEIDLERFVDDFVFMCFFVGNDFLPHMPTLSIYERAVDLLLAVYKKEFKSLGGYLTDGCKPDLKRVSRFIHAIGSYEERIFRKRAIIQQCRERKIMREMAEEASRNEDEEYLQEFDTADDPNTVLPVPESSIRSRDVWQSSPGTISSFAATAASGGNCCRSQEHENERELKKKLKDLLRQKSDVFRSKSRQPDKVRLGEAGWRQRYYQLMFRAGTPEDMQTIRQDVALRYAEGLLWVMQYYYEGVCSWKWFYPYHYAPFASDLGGIGMLKIKLERGTPFKPFDQLLAVLPAASDHALPKPYRSLMSDPSSPLISFYPTDFDLDMDGKRYSWQGIVKLLFIDELSLRKEAEKIENRLTDEEMVRNSAMFDKLFVAASHPLAEFIISLSHRCSQSIQKSEVIEKINPELSDGMNGYLTPVFRSPIGSMRDISTNAVVCAVYRLPDAHEHIPRPPPGIVFPEQTVEPWDLDLELVLWHEDSGRPNFAHRNWWGRPGTLSSRDVGDPAHRLIINRLESGGTDHCRYDTNVDVPSTNQIPLYVPPPARRHNTSHRIQDQRRRGMAFRPLESGANPSCPSGDGGNQHCYRPRGQQLGARPPVGTYHNFSQVPGNRNPRSHHNYQKEQQRGGHSNQQSRWRQSDSY